MMLLQSPNADITPPAQRFGLDELHLAITAIRDDSISSLADLQGATESSEPHIVQPYWFSCPECKFDWREWLKLSIIFVSLSFISKRFSHPTLMLARGMLQSSC